MEISLENLFVDTGVNDYYEQVGADSCVYHKGYLALLHNLVQSDSVNTDNDGA